MASLTKIVTASNTISTGPGSIDGVLVGTHNGSSFKFYSDVDGWAITGTYFPSSVANSNRYIPIGAVSGTAIRIEVDPAAGNSVIYTVFFNGDPIRPRPKKAS